jgi:hypothetical protein
MSDAIIIGGPKYSWHGKFISTKSINNFNYASMPKDGSMIMIPIAIESNQKYKITIVANKKNSGTGFITAEFFGGRWKDGTIETIQIKSKYDAAYKTFINAPTLPEHAIIYLKLRKLNCETGNIFIKTITIKKQNKEKIKKPTQTIVYFVSKAEQKRVFQCIEDGYNSEVQQIFLGPTPVMVENSKFKYLEDYSEMKIERKIEFDTLKVAQNIINELDPDIFVCGTLPNFYQIQLPKVCKKVYISHGLIGDHVKTIKEIKKYSTRWRGCELYCGAGKNFCDFIKFMNTAKNKYKILLNAMPQFDILKDTDSQNMFKNELIEENKIPKADKYILFAGFGGSTRSDFIEHNDDYYRTAIYLDKIAKKNNWFVFIKPRLEPNIDLKFIQENKELNKYIEEYNALWKSENICMIRKCESIYKYFFVDQVVANGCSTVEIETCCVNKPLVIVRTQSINYDPFETVISGAAKLVNTDSIDELEKTLIGDFEQNIICQKKLLESQGISFDGEMSKRVKEAIFELL